MMNNPLPSSPAHREAGLTLGDLMQSFTLEESFKMAYLPVILTKSAFEYARFAHRICVEKRLSFNKPCREIRQAIDDLDRRYLYTIQLEAQETLRAKVEDFFDEADNNLQTLWYTIKNQLAKQYPDVGNYDLLANIYMAVVLLDYVGKLECAISRKIRQRTGKPYAARIPKECADLRRALMSIAGAYRMDHTGTLRTAIIALANKANSMIKVTVTR